MSSRWMRTASTSPGTSTRRTTKPSAMPSLPASSPTPMSAKSRRKRSPSTGRWRSSRPGSAAGCHPRVSEAIARIHNRQLCWTGCTDAVTILMAGQWLSVPTFAGMTLQGSKALGPLEDEIHPRAKRLAIALPLQQLRDIHLPTLGDVGDDEERGIKRGWRIAEERVEDQVLGPFHIELDGVDMGKAFPLQEVQQRHGRHADRVRLA